ncbi:27757_t:CDS:2, partial [Gigaspora margarita]
SFAEATSTQDKDNGSATHEENKDRRINLQLFKPFVEATSTQDKDNRSTTHEENKDRKRRHEDFNSRLLGTIVTEEDSDEGEGDEKKELESSDDEEHEIIVNENFLNFDEAVQPSNSKWKLSNGKLVKNVLSQKTSMLANAFKNRKLDAYTASVIRLGLSSIVDLSSEFPNGMRTWFGEEWSSLKQKVQNEINMAPVKFEGCILESIEKIEKVHYHYWDAREYLLEQMKNRFATMVYLQTMKIYFTIMDMLLNDPYIFVNEDGKENKLTEMEFVLKAIAPIMDIIFSDVHQIRLRWGETVSKTSTACRKIDLRIETREKHIELSHTECSKAPTPAKIVRDRSKILRTNKCVLDNYLRWDIPDQAVEDSAVFAFQFAVKMCLYYLVLMNSIGLHGQLLAVDLLDDGLYFGLDGPAFKIPSQLSNIRCIRSIILQ